MLGTTGIPGGAPAIPGASIPGRNIPGGGTMPGGNMPGIGGNDADWL